MDLDISAVSFESGRRALQLAVDGGGSSSSSIAEIASLLAEEVEDYRNSSSLDPIDHQTARPLSCDHHTALGVAASAGHMAAIQRLLEAGADPNAPLHKPGISALEAAAAKGRLLVVQRLLEASAHPDHCGECTSSTPLIAAARAGHEAICKTLMQSGADASILKSHYYSYYYSTCSAIKVAVETSNLTLLRLFLEPLEHAAKGFDEEDLKRAIAEGRLKDSQRLLRTKDFLSTVGTTVNHAVAEAAVTGNMPVLQSLLDSGLGTGIFAPRVRTHPESYNAIAFAAYGGHLEVVNKLLQTASDQNMLQVGVISEALQLAMDEGHMALLEPLLQAGADVMAIDIRNAAAGGHLDALTFMLQSGASVDTRWSTRWWNDLTPLQLAARHGHAAVVEFLLAHGVNINERVDREGRMGPTAVQLAAAGGHLALTKRLIDAGARVNVEGEAADTGLQAAIRAGDTAMLELLLAAGADVRAVAIDWNRFEREPRRACSALSIAAGMNNSGLVTRLLSMMPPDDARQAAQLALYEAVENHHVNIVQQLLQLHPNVNYGPLGEPTLLQMVATNGSLEILELLLSEGADVDFLPGNRCQQTALQSASERGDLAAVKLLLAAGAEVNVTELTAPPLLLAVRGGHIHIYEHLLAAGADIHATAYRGQTLLEAAEESGDADIQGRVRLALDSRPAPQVDQPLVRGTGPLCKACRVAPLADMLGRRVSDLINFALHPSLTAFRASAALGCPLCCFIWKRLGATSICIPQSWPLELWMPGREDTIMCRVAEPLPDREPREGHEFFTTEISYVLSFPGEVPSRVPITEDTSSPETYRQIKTWLDNCKTEHPKCRARFGNQSLPTRLIYLETPGDASLTHPVNTSLQPRLVSTSGMECLERGYIALSYRWPPDSPAEAKATQGNIREQMRGLNTSKLPQIFNDLFQVAVRLGISYVWIDSLCIVQDDPEDWGREAALMIQIYRNAEFTVAAAVPPTYPDLGLFRHGDPSDVLSARISNLAGSQKDGQSQDLMLMKPQKEAYGESPLVSRGWCFQEREISRRIVHYTETQVLWECHTFRASEGLPDGFKVSEKERVWTSRIFDNDLSVNNVDGVWGRAVEDYSSRHLTVFTDKLPALAGLAAAISDYKPANCRYLAGLWEDNFLMGLQWSSLRHPDGETFPNTRHPEYVAPTWSWASVAGPISYSEARGLRFYDPHDITEDPANYALKVLDIHVQTSTSDPFGAVRHAVLTCTAGLVPGVVKPSSLPLLNPFEVDTEEGHEIGEMALDVPQERFSGDGVAVVFCIYTGVPARAGLAVLPTGNKENEYRRVGRMDGMRPAYFEDAEVKEITIV